jgi:SAM-dependent methyltransferase
LRLRTSDFADRYSDPVNPTQRFSDRVEHYVRSRPPYPPAFFDLFRDRLALAPGAAIADVGSGTGISAGPLVARGYAVYAVEPNGPMRAAAERQLAAHARFHSVDGAAESTTLPDRAVDAVLAAQAFHWFDRPRARAEFARILRPGGWGVIVWNERRLDATPFLREYESLLHRFGTDYGRVRHENIDAAALAKFFAPAAYDTLRFDNAQHFDYAGLESRLLSSSYTPAADDPRRPPMLADLRHLFDQHQQGGRVTFEYDTRAYVGHLA